MGGATHDLTLVDSSDDDALFTVPGPAAARARPSRRLVLVPESVDATPQSIQDREWEPTVSPVAPEVSPMSDNADVEVATVPRATVGGLRTVVLVPFSPGTLRSIQDHTARSSGSRFAVLESDDEAIPAQLRQPEGPSNQEIGFEEGDGAHTSDTESLHGRSDFEGVPDSPVPATEPEREANQVEVGPRIRKAFRSLDEVDVAHLFRIRAVVMKSPPKFVRGAYCAAMRIALQEIVEGSEAHNEDRQCRGWKLFLLLPRMLLFRPPRGGLIPKNRLLERLAMFATGQWTELFILSRESSEIARNVAIRRRRTQVDSPEKPTYLWEDDEGVVHEVLQGEGGEQGDALMPALFSLGQHRSLEALQVRLRPSE